MQRKLFLIPTLLYLFAPAQMKLRGLQNKSGSDSLVFAFGETDTTSLTKLSLYATQYYVYEVKQKGTIPLKDANEKELPFYLDTCDWCLAAIEGTLLMSDSAGNKHVLNYAGRSKEQQVDCKLCKSLTHYKNTAIGKTLWTVSSGYGDGVAGYKLVPFRTIAVDKNKISYGSVIYIPSIRGKKFYSGTDSLTHDGYFFSGDTGGDIKGNHIDIFTGSLRTNPFPLTITSDSAKGFDAFLVTDTSVVNGMKKMHVR